jgi:hypothetical protein
MATDTDLIILLGGHTFEVQREKGEEEDKSYRADPATAASPFHKALPALIFFDPREKWLDYT